MKDFAKFMFTVRGFYINLQVKVTGKNENFQSVFFPGGCLKLKLRFAEKK